MCATPVPTNPPEYLSCLRERKEFYSLSFSLPKSHRPHHHSRRCDLVISCHVVWLITSDASVTPTFISSAPLLARKTAIPTLVGGDIKERWTISSGDQRKATSVCVRRTASNHTPTRRLSWKVKLNGLMLMKTNILCCRFYRRAGRRRVRLQRRRC